MAARVPAWSWMLPAIILLMIAIVQLARGRSQGIAFLVLGVVFLVLALTVAWRNRSVKPPPPEA